MPTTTLITPLIDGLADGSVEVVDLTQPLSERTPVLKLPEPFANTPPLTRRTLSRYDERGRMGRLPRVFPTHVSDEVRLAT